MAWLWYWLGYYRSNENIVSYNDDECFPYLQIQWERLLLIVAKQILNIPVSSNFRLKIYKVATSYRNNFVEQEEPYMYTCVKAGTSDTILVLTLVEIIVLSVHS